MKLSGQLRLIGQMMQPSVHADPVIAASEIIAAAEKALRKLVDEHDPVLAARILGMIENAQTNYRSPGGGK